MTKLMFCGECADIVAPGENLEVRWCKCKRHAMWWKDGAKGQLRFLRRLGVLSQLISELGCAPGVYSALEGGD